jgi:hypothetical protein
MHLRRWIIGLCLWALWGGNSPDVSAAVLAVGGQQFLLDARRFDMWGIRAASASQSSGAYSAPFSPDQGTSTGLTNHYDLAGQGTAENSGVRCYFQAVKAAGTGVANSGESSTAEHRLQEYRGELAAFRKEFGGTRELPPVHSFLFGMGSRPKLLYKSGALIDSVTGKILRQWPDQSEIILPPEYSVFITTRDGRSVRLVEDEQAVWVEENRRKEPVASVLHVSMKRDANLVDIVDAGDGLSGGFTPRQDGKEHGCQNRNDGNDDQQFDERDSGPMPLCSKPLTFRFWAHDRGSLRLHAGDRI